MAVGKTYCAGGCEQDAQGGEDGEAHGCLWCMLRELFGWMIEGGGSRVWIDALLSSGGC